jgi:hypothetical protein
MDRSPSGADNEDAGPDAAVVPLGKGFDSANPKGGLAETNARKTQL